MHTNIKSSNLFIAMISIWLLLSSGLNFSQNIPPEKHPCVGKAHEQCLKEIAEQILSFTENFRSAFLKSRGVSNYNQAVSASTQEMSNAMDYIELGMYPNHCIDGMANIAKNPEKPLQFSFETARPHLENCIKQTVNFSEQLNVSVDKTEAARLKKRVDEISKYFKANPPMNQKKTKQGPPII